MSVSLTKDEFWHRFLQNQRLLELAIEDDVKRISPLLLRVSINEANIDIDHTDVDKAIGELIGKEIVRVVDLVYNEALT